jgi:hypothetical protein
MKGFGIMKRENMSERKNDRQLEAKQDSSMALFWNTRRNLFSLSFSLVMHGNGRKMDAWSSHSLCVKVRRFIIDQIQTRHMDIICMLIKCGR